MYETDVVWEYLNKISDFLKFKICNKFFYGILLIKAYPVSGNKNYIEYLNKTYNTFTTRLISCPICLGFWISLIFSAYFRHLNLVFVYSFLSMCLYYLIKILTKLSSKI